MNGASFLLRAQREQTTYRLAVEGGTPVIRKQSDEFVRRVGFIGRRSDGRPGRRKTGGGAASPTARSPRAACAKEPPATRRRRERAVVTEAVRSQAAYVLRESSADVWPSHSSSGSSRRTVTSCRRRFSTRSISTARCGACHGIPPSQHTTSTSCDRSDCHGNEVTLLANGTPLISASGDALHIDGVVESARGAATSVACARCARATNRTP